MSARDPAEAPDPASRLGPHAAPHPAVGGAPWPGPLPAGEAAVAALDLAAVRETAALLAPHVARTPAIPWRGRDLEARLAPGTRVGLKLELHQHSGTFKARGAFHVMLRQPAEALAGGVTAISAGNHALAVAHAARELGLHAKVVMLASANPYRVARCRELGAELVLVDDAARGFALVEELQRDEGRFFVHPFDGLLTSLGTATLGLEMTEQLAELDAVVVPVGGGGLASGVAAAVKLAAPGCRVYGVEPSGAPTLTRALAAGEPVTLDGLATVADSLGAPFTGPTSFALCRAHLDDVVLLEEEAFAGAQRLLFEALGLAVEPACAAATAALLGPLRERCAGQHIGLVLCGSNIDLETYRGQVSASDGGASGA